MIAPTLGYPHADQETAPPLSSVVVEQERETAEKLDCEVNSDEASNPLHHLLDFHSVEKAEFALEKLACEIVEEDYANDGKGGTAAPIASALGENIKAPAWPRRTRHRLLPWRPRLRRKGRKSSTTL